MKKKQHFGDFFLLDATTAASTSEKRPKSNTANPADLSNKAGEVRLEIKFTINAPPKEVLKGIILEVSQLLYKINSNSNNRN